MTITINGSGTITGITAGGLPDAIITTAEIVDANITAAKLSGASSGSAPIYGARAWVNFNGTGTVAIRASGNVSSITDNSTGDYTVNFTTALSDANYAAVGSTQGSGVSVLPVISVNQGNSQTTSLVNIYTTGGTTATPSDFNYVTVAVFR